MPESGCRPFIFWNPPFCSDIDMRIARDRTWYLHELADRAKALMKLFASVMRHDEDGKYYLVTPAEKCGIRVDDASFVAIRMTLEGKGREQVFSFETNTDDMVTVDDTHPFRVAPEEETGGLKPYVLVRARLEALVSRALFYDLVARGTVEERKASDGSGCGRRAGSGRCSAKPRSASRPDEGFPVRRQRISRTGAPTPAERAVEPLRPRRR